MTDFRLFQQLHAMHLAGPDGPRQKPRPKKCIRRARKLEAEKAKAREAFERQRRRNAGEWMNVHATYEPAVDAGVYPPEGTLDPSLPINFQTRMTTKPNN